MHLVYLSPVHWESFAQRPHKFVEWFHARTGGKVLWLEPYPTRLPNMGDFSRRGSSVDRLLNKSPEWLTVIKPGGLPIEPIPGTDFVNRHRWRKVVDAAEEFARGKQVFLVIGKPSNLALLMLERLKRSVSLYDAMDDFPAFYSGLSRLSMRSREQALARKVDMMWTSSTELMNRWSRTRNDVVLVRNGLDPAVLPVPVDRPPQDVKVFGYLGTIAKWFDWDWLFALAEAQPKDEIRLIGPVFNPPAGQLPANVTMHPACDHATGLRLMTQFDIGLIPFKKTELTASVDPIKYYEYRSLGIPVISTDFGEMRFRSDEAGVFISRQQADVAGVADEALRFGLSDGRDGQFLARNAWNSRFDDTGILTRQQ